MSSIEVDFTAACKPGKAILYICLIFKEIEISQDEAITLFTDNSKETCQ